MRYWDTSGLASLLLTDRHSASAAQSLDADPNITTWWVTCVECQSAIWNNERRGLIQTTDAEAAQQRLQALRKLWIEIPPTERIRNMAGRFLRVHDLRAADALQLAAAHEACSDRPEELPFVTNDRRLAAAARKEGFPIISNEELA